MKKTSKTIQDNRHEYLDSLTELYDDIDQAINRAGAIKKFKEFSKASFNYYKKNIGKKIDPTSAPAWSATIQLGDKFYFAAALTYLLIVYGFDYDYLNTVLMEEYDHYDEAIKNNFTGIFYLRFFYDQGGLSVEPSTFVIDYQNTGKTHLNKLNAITKAPLKREGTGSEWDDKMISLSGSKN